jgi:hypothetical protein
MARDDLFTHIHKALRLGLFEVTMRAGATDWTDVGDVARLERRWRPLQGLLESHTRHEDRHILRVLDRHDRSVTAPIDEEHRTLDATLAGIALAFDRAVREHEANAGLDFYRALACFVGAYLPHLHEEETVVMPRIWELCTDEEIAATRAAFMAELTPDETALSMELMLPAVDPRSRAELVATIAATAPPPVLETVMSIAARVLDADDLAALQRGAGVALGV